MVFGAAAFLGLGAAFLTVDVAFLGAIASERRPRTEAGGLKGSGELARATNSDNSYGARFGGKRLLAGCSFNLVEGLAPMSQSHAFKFVQIYPTARQAGVTVCSTPARLGLCLVACELCSPIYI